MLAIILAGGKGTRLKPYTTVFPKALVPLGEMPVLELVLRQLKNHGFNEIIISVGHLAHLIETFFGNGEKLGLNITYAREDFPLGTAGPMLHIEKTLRKLPENFMIMNADVVSDINFAELYKAHEQANRLATIATYRRTSQINFGLIDFDAENLKIEGFREKPILEHSVSMGIYMFNRRILDFIEPDCMFNYDTLMKNLVKAHEDIFVYPFNSYWLDIGRVDDYEQAIHDFQEKRDLLLPESSPVA